MNTLKKEKIDYDKRNIYIDHRLNLIIDEIAHIQRKPLKEVFNDILKIGIEEQIKNNTALKFKLSVTEYVNDEEQAEIEESLASLTEDDRKPALLRKYNPLTKQWEETYLN